MQDCTRILFPKGLTRISKPIKNGIITDMTDLTLISDAHKFVPSSTTAHPNDQPELWAGA